jgi:hypothetical protein
MKQKEKIALIILVVLSLGLVSFIVIKKYRKPKNLLLLGGLDNRSGDLSIDEQVALVEKGVSDSISVEGFRYNDKSGIINTISNSKKEMYVVLFSAGCSKSKDVTNALKQKGYNLNYMFIVEPYAKSITTTQSVRDAVSMGVPTKNVIVGNSKSTGLGVIDNPTLTPICSPKHWCSLTEVGKFIK